MFSARIMVPLRGVSTLITLCNYRVFIELFLPESRRSRRVARTPDGFVATFRPAATSLAVFCRLREPKATDLLKWPIYSTKTTCRDYSRRHPVANESFSSARNSPIRIPCLPASCATQRTPLRHTICTKIASTSTSSFRAREHSNPRRGRSNSTRVTWFLSLPKKNIG